MGLRDEDLNLLARLLDRDELPKGLRNAFGDMKTYLLDGDRHCLSKKQRDWAKETLDKYEPSYTNDVSTGRVPRGREVPTIPTIAALWRENLPLKPPGRK